MGAGHRQAVISDTISVTLLVLDNFHKTEIYFLGGGSAPGIVIDKNLVVGLIDDLIFDTLRGPIRMQSGGLISAHPPQYQPSLTGEFYYQTIH